MRQRAEPAGFTLIEMLVAIVLMLLLVLPLMRSFSTGLAVRTRSDMLTEATMVAEAELETIAANRSLNGERSSDRVEGRYSIHSSAAPYAVGVMDDGLPVQPYEIRVTVSWPEGARSRAVTLRALRLGHATQVNEPAP
jgi:prepilin-type N-terminal cleavage/methylation domain-containing protein